MVWDGMGEEHKTKLYLFQLFLHSSHSLCSHKTFSVALIHVSIELREREGYLVNAAYIVYCWPVSVVPVFLHTHTHTHTPVVDLEI